MAKYTLELRELFEPIKFNPPLFSREEVEGWFKDYSLYDYLRPKEVAVIESAKIWSKDRLASQIVDHYYMREIGQETPALFKHFAKVKMQELMEEYLPLIYSSAIEYDPLINVDYKEIFERENTENVASEGSATSSDSANSSNLSVHSDTPQGQISKDEILQGKWASDTDASQADSTSEGTTSSSTNTSTKGNENYTKHIIGNSGVSATAQKMIELYRNNIRAINREIIDKLDDLFMGLW